MGSTLRELALPVMAEPTPFSGMPGLRVGVVRPNLKILCPFEDESAAYVV
jgi:hypothetical protein